MERDARIAELACQGKSYTDIGKIIGISQGRVSQIISQFKAEWAAKSQVAIADHIEVETAHLRRVREEAWQAWEKSKEDGVTVTTIKMPPRTIKGQHVKATKALKVIRQEEKRVGQVGDVACLHIVESSTDKLLKLLGAYPKEEKTEVNNVVQINWGDLSNPIVAVEPLQTTPSTEVEKRIAAESSNGKSNSNGNGHV